MTAMKFSLFFERIAWGALTAIILYAGGQLKEMSVSVQQLSTSVTILLERSRTSDQTTNEVKQLLKDYEGRIHLLEMKR